MILPHMLDEMYEYCGDIMRRMENIKESDDDYKLKIIRDLLMSQFTKEIIIQLLQKR